MKWERVFKMKTRILGKDLEVSAVGLGCMGLSHAYGEATDKEKAIELIKKAVEIGYTFFDTAECYIGQNHDGSISYNEEIVGEALCPYRGKVKIATKFGVRHEGAEIITDSRPETIRASIEGSLKRLKVDCIDLYYQHRIDPKVSPEEVANVMAELIKEGKISHWGISEANEEYLRRAHKICPVTAVQNRYSMMYRDYEKLFSVLEKLNVGFVAFSPLANGLLTAKYDEKSSFPDGDYRNNMPQFQRNAFVENQKLMELLEKTAIRHQATPAQISLAWMIDKKPYIVPIPGTRKTERLIENAEASELILTQEEVRKLDDALENMRMSEVFGGHKVR